MRTMSNTISRFGLLVALILLPAFVSANAAQYVQYGNSLLGQKKYDEAIRYFGGALKTEPKNAAAYKGIGYAYVYKGDKAKALQYLNYASQLNPADTQLAAYVAQMKGGAAAPAAGGSAADVAYQNGLRYMQARQYQYAAYYFNQATTADPNSAKSWQALGNAFYAQSQKEKAIQAWERAVSLDPSNTQLAQYVASLKGGSSATASASTAPSAAAEGGEEKAKGFNPWIMGSTVAVLGAVMLFLF